MAKSISVSEEPLHQLPYPVVGIGASAGGLEALQEFFTNMDPDPGAAFVIIQHLSPDYKSFMNELLARCTSIPIHVAQNDMLVEKNNIYLLPPKMNMTIREGKLLLSEISDKRFLNLPIDIFFRSLAQDQQKNAISIILSGTGSDGTLGVRAIKEFGGMTMVQDDRSAKFDGMPKSSISTGMIDFVSNPFDLAAELLQYIKHPLIRQSRKLESLLDGKMNHLERIIDILKESKQVDFANYKENTIHRRLEKRISINRFDKIEDYIKFLDGNQKEISILFNELLIGVTRFFRDEATFIKFKTKILPKLIEEHQGKKELRVWVAGCSTGEEAYTIAMLIKDHLIENHIQKDVKIFATDLDKSSIDFAGTGLYPDNIASDVPTDLLVKYFTRKERGYQIIESIRSMIIFAQHNILNDPPFSKLDLISCRNLLIYLNNDVQQKIISTFHVCLNQNGLMLLGSSESLGNMAEGFQVIDQKAKIYKKITSYKPGFFNTIGINTTAKTRSDLIGSSIYRSNKSRNNFVERIFNEVLHDYLPPSIIIDDQYNVLHTIHNVSHYLNIPIGHVSFNLLKMLPKDLSVTLSSLIRRTEKTRNEITLDNISLESRNSLLSIKCKYISDSQLDESYFLISFIEVEKKEQKKVPSEKININTQYQERIEELERELQVKSESLQATVEELETSNEELQSSNEELIASNEELQSTNEELQSVNEELYTVNSEHLRKIDELTELNSDFDNLLKNTHLGNLYLDKSLCIRKINDVASRLTNILPIDIGRPIQHLSFGNLYKNFVEDVKKAADRLVTIEHEIQDDNGHWFLMRILPYRTIENAIDGIIILFIEISNIKEYQAKLQQTTDRLDYALNAGEMSWWEWDMKQNRVLTGEGKYTMLGYTKNQVGDGFEWWTSLIHEDDYEKAMDAMRDHLSGKKDSYIIEYRIRHKDRHFVWYRDKGKVVKRDKNGKPELLTGIVINISHEMEQQEVLNIEKRKANAFEDKYLLLFNSINKGIVFQNGDGQLVNANPAAERILGVSLEEMKSRTSASEEWKPLKADKTFFPGSEHPAMVALRTGLEIKNSIMGVYNPKLSKYVWIKIDAIPLFQEGQQNPYQVYTIFEEVDEPK